MKNKFKKGESVLLTNQYFIDKRKVDMPLYGRVLEEDDEAQKVRIEDYKGNVYLVDAFLLEKDNVHTLKDEKTDSKQDKEIKKFLKIIAKDLCSDDYTKAKVARDTIESDLYCEESDVERMIKELNVRRAITKYVFNARKQISDKLFKELISDDEYCDRLMLIDDREETIQIAIETFGIFQELADKERDKELLEKKSLEEAVAHKKKQSSGENFFDFVDKLLSDIESMPPTSDVDSLFNFDPFGLDADLDKKSKDKKEEKDSSKSKPLGSFGLMTSKPKVELPDCLIDMTALAAKGRYNEIIGREDEIDQVAETLARKEIRNPLLIGKPGAGKTAVVEELVKRSYNGEIPHLRNKRFYELRMNDLVAGTMYRGQLEQKLKDVMQVLEDDPNVVLFIDEVHMIVQAGTTAEDKNDVANALKPYLTSEISIIGATTFDEYRATFANDGALARRFNPISIEEKSKEESVEIICKVKDRFEKYHGVELSEDTVRMIIDEIETRKSDNSLIAGALTAVDTICTKMKIKHLSEKQAFRRWSNEVVLGVDRTNKGGKTQKIGFNFGKDELDEEELEEVLDDLDEDELDGTLEESEEMNEPSDVIYLTAKEFLRLVDKDLERKDRKDDISDALGEYGISVLSKEEYQSITFDYSDEGYEKYLLESIEQEIEDEDEVDEGSDESENYDYDSTEEEIEEDDEEGLD